MKMTAMSLFFRFIFLPFFLLTAGFAQAQLSIEITGAGANRIPVTIVDFPGDPADRKSVV